MNQQESSDLLDQVTVASVFGHCKNRSVTREDDSLQGSKCIGLTCTTSAFEMHDILRSLV